MGALVCNTLVAVSAALSFSTALKMIYSQHSGRPDLVRPVSLFVTFEGAICRAQIRSALELFIVFFPLLIVIGSGFRLISEGISEEWVLESRWYSRDRRIIRFRIPGGWVHENERQEKIEGARDDRAERGLAGGRLLW